MEIVNLLENFETKPGTKCSGATYTIASMWIASKFRRGERSEQEQKIEIYSMNLLPDRLHFWQSPSFPVPSSTPAVPSSDGKKTGRRPSYRPFSKIRATSDLNHWILHDHRSWYSQLHFLDRCFCQATYKKSNRNLQSLSHCLSNQCNDKIKKFVLRLKLGHS